MKLISYALLTGLAFAWRSLPSSAQNAPLNARIAQLAQAEEAKVIA